MRFTFQEKKIMSYIDLHGFNIINVDNEERNKKWAWWRLAGYPPPILKVRVDNIETWDALYIWCTENGGPDYGPTNPTWSGFLVQSAIRFYGVIDIFDESFALHFKLRWYEST